jgi:AraC-like DNA-binding protein
MPVPERTYLPTDVDAVLWPPADATAGVYGSVAPSDDLAGLVACVQVGTEVIPRDAPLRERVLPDGAVHLTFNLGDAPTVLEGADGHLGSANGAEALGPSCSPAVIRMVGRIDAIGVRLHAGGALALLGVPAAALVGRTVPLDDLWGPLAAETCERLAAAPPGVGRVAVLEDALRERLRRARHAAPVAGHAGVAEAARLIARSDGRRSVRDLATAVGVGERRLEQLFHAHVGLSPKAASRLARFRASVRVLRREPALRWSEIAHACGFADHAHLTHEYRALTGLTPRAFRERLGFGFPQDPRAGAR